MRKHSQIVNLLFIPIGQRLIIKIYFGKNRLSGRFAPFITILNCGSVGEKVIFFLGRQI